MFFIENGKMKRFESLALLEEANIGAARRVVRRIAAEAGFDERRLAEIDIAVNEIGSNAVKFARGTGQLYCARADLSFEPEGIELIYLDKGPGIEDTSSAMLDGFTTTGSLGAGLGAIRRMADEFWIYSTIESQTRKLAMYGRTTHGTAMIFRKRAVAPDETTEKRPAIWGAMTRPAIGEEQNGDAYMIQRFGNRQIIAVIDGLGHGEGAMEASRAAVASIQENALKPVETIIRLAHEELRPTRGAVLGLGVIDLETGVIEYSGIGNTDFRAFGGGITLKFISLNGTLGSRLERVKVFKEQLPKVATIILSTDGISERWDIESYPGLLGLHPQMLCAVAMRDHSRPKDDATIICGRMSF
jgi:anti-sigma regulatory factor (Ser/Thr protein kinase)